MSKQLKRTRTRTQTRTRSFATIEHGDDAQAFLTPRLTKRETYSYSDSDSGSDSGSDDYWFSAIRADDLKLLLTRATGPWTLVKTISKSGYACEQAFVCELLPPQTKEDTEDIEDQDQEEYNARYILVDVYNHQSPDDRDCGMMINVYFGVFFQSLVKEIKRNTMSDHEKLRYNAKRLWAFLNDSKNPTGQAQARAQLVQV